MAFAGGWEGITSCDRCAAGSSLYATWSPQCGRAPIKYMVARLLMSLVLLSATVAENPAVVADRLDGREKQLENL